MKSRIAFYLLTAALILPGCDQLAQIQELEKQIGELKAVNQQLTEKVAQYEKEIVELQNKHKRNVETLFR
ncbi:hypothetical protein HUU62_10190 [Rhodoferax sp. 4810]|uniref:Uncharacterized protein n=1 Tax=Thiospirillum jenense TaxID=1653858 RepID=A0A839HI77_9GAMM|nr:hypothetical protein [Thiospirillum jenense]MBB1074779.1 hypothetical protein [Rhodoferax jenense]MBB1126617.1 hypothetical protein [Thiospirillum jenense]